MAFTLDNSSPIRWISSVASPSASQRTYVRSPSAYQYDLQDVSESDAGRTEDGKMHKKRIGQVCKISMSWNNIDTQAVSTLLQMFQPEYLYVNYLDAYTGTYRTDYFYVGDRAAPMYTNYNTTSSTVKGLWSNVAFNLIRVDGGTNIS